MQERELSPRVIYFTASQVLWECRLSRLSEKSPFEKRRQRKLREISLRCLDSIWSIEPASSEPENVQARWAQIVQRYSLMSLTNIEDRLHALSGLAERFQKLYMSDSENSDYLGGIWANHLPESLLWYAQPDIEQLSDDDGQKKPEKTYLPSWSWISVNDPVFHAFPTTPYKPFVEVVETKVTPTSSSNRFGNLSSGRIVLRGWTRPRAEYLPTHEGTSIVHDYWDTGAYRKTYKDAIVCIYFRIDEKWALILVPAASENKQYKRVGLCNLVLNSWWINAEKKVVEII
jgi:hypothetical protein